VFDVTTGKREGNHRKASARAAAASVAIHAAIIAALLLVGQAGNP